MHIYPVIQTWRCIFPENTTEASRGIRVWSEWSLYQVESFQGAFDDGRLRPPVSKELDVHATDWHIILL